MKGVLEARFDRSRSLRDLEFIIQANLMVQRGELTITEAEGLEYRTNFDSRFYTERQGIVAAAVDDWLAELTAEGRERRMGQSMEWKYEPTPRQQELDKFWNDRFKLRPNLGGIRFGLARVQYVKTSF